MKKHKGIFREVNGASHECKWFKRGNQRVLVDTVTNEVIVHNPGALGKLIKFGSKFIPLPGASVIGDVVGGLLGSEQEQPGQPTKAQPGQRMTRPRVDRVEQALKI